MRSAALCRRLAFARARRHASYVSCTTSICASTLPHCVFEGVEKVNRHRRSLPRSLRDSLRAAGNQPPAVRHGLLLWLGIEVGRALDPGLHDWEAGLLLLSVLLLALDGRARSLGTVSCGLLLAALGTGPGSLKPGVEHAVSKDELRTGVPVSAVITGCGTWKEREFGRVARCHLSSARLRSRVIPLSGAIYVRVPLDSEDDLNCARMRGILRQPVPPRNPPVAQVGAPGDPSLTVKSNRLIEAFDCSSEWSGLSRIGLRLRRSIEQSLLLQGEQSPSFAQRLAAAMWLGERDHLSRREQAGLRNWGLTHLLAVSGLHVGVLLALGMLFIQSWPGSHQLGRPMLALVWVIFAGSWIILTVGPRVSVLRALLMAMMVLISRLAKRPSGALANAGIALVVMTALAPESVPGLSFRLSFAATLGIIGGAPALAAAWSGLPRWLAMPLAVSVAAQLATLPWTLAIHPVVPLAGPLANLIAVPAAALTLIQTPLWMAWGSVGRGDPVGGGSGTSGSAWIDSIATGVLGFPARTIEWLALLDPLPWLQPTWAWDPWWSALWAAGVFAWALAPRRRWALLALLGGALWWPAEGHSQMSFLDVGQGDATLVRSGKQALLIDGGGWRGGEVGARVLLPVIARERLRRLDAAILTHADFDHCAGLLELSWVIEIQELWVGPGQHTGACGRALLERFDRRVVILSDLETRQLGDWSLTVVSNGAASSTSNGRSLILRAESNGWSALLTGDVDARTERRLLAARAAPDKRSLIDVDWLKVAHHGSKTSTSQELLDHASPSISVISAGHRNPYGHPSPTVMRRLSAGGSTILRTDLDGRIDYCPRDDC